MIRGLIGAPPSVPEKLHNTLSVALNAWLLAVMLAIIRAMMQIDQPGNRRFAIYSSVPLHT
jgi:hypothetical protein